MSPTVVVVSKVSASSDIVLPQRSTLCMATENEEDFIEHTRVRYSHCADEPKVSRKGFRGTLMGSLLIGIANHLKKVCG